MTQKCLKATELCLSGLPVERECFTWNIFLYVIFLNHVCSEALWPGGSDHCSTLARLWWRVCLLLLNINTAPPASDWGAAKKKKKKRSHSFQSRTNWVSPQHSASVTSQECVWMCFCTLPLWELELCPQLHTDPLHRSSFYRNTFRTDFPAVPRWTWSFFSNFNRLLCCSGKRRVSRWKACEVGYTSIICTCTGDI